MKYYEIKILRHRNSNEALISAYLQQGGVENQQGSRICIRCDQTWGQFSIGIDGQFWNCSFKKMELINLELQLNPQIHLPFNLLIQKYFFHNNPT